MNATTLRRKTCAPREGERLMCEGTIVNKVQDNRGVKGQQRCIEGGTRRSGFVP